MFFFAANLAGREYAEPEDFQRQSATVDGLAVLLDHAQHDLERSLGAYMKQGCPDTVLWPNAPAGTLAAAAALAQIFDHAALHRTQAINILKRHAVSPLPDLDPLTFASAQAAQSPARSQLSKDLLECFQRLDGALPEVALCNMPTPLAREVFSALLDIDANTAARAKALTHFDGVHVGDLESYRHELNSASFRGTMLPQLVIWVLPEWIGIEFRASCTWTHAAIRAFIDLFGALRTIAPNAPLDYTEFRIQEAFEAALAVPTATRYHRFRK